MQGSLGNYRHLRVGFQHPASPSRPSRIRGPGPTARVSWRSEPCLKEHKRGTVRDVFLLCRQRNFSLSKDAHLWEMHTHQPSLNKTGRIQCPPPPGLRSKAPSMSHRRNHYHPSPFPALQFYSMRLWQVNSPSQGLWTQNHKQKSTALAVGGEKKAKQGNSPQVTPSNDRVCGNNDCACLHTRAPGTSPQHPPLHLHKHKRGGRIKETAQNQVWTDLQPWKGLEREACERCPFWERRTKDDPPPWVSSVPLNAITSCFRRWWICKKL